MSEEIGELTRAGYVVCDFAWQAQKGLHEATEEFQGKYPTEFPPAYSHVLAWAKTKQGTPVDSGVLATLEFADGQHTGTGTDSLSALYLFLRTLPSDVRQDLTSRLLNLATEPLVKSAGAHMPLVDSEVKDEASARKLGERLGALDGSLQKQIIEGMAGAWSLKGEAEPLAPPEPPESA